MKFSDASLWDQLPAEIQCYTLRLSIESIVNEPERVKLRQELTLFHKVNAIWKYCGGRHISCICRPCINGSNCQNQEESIKRLHKHCHMKVFGIRNCDHHFDEWWKGSRTYLGLNLEAANKVVKFKKYLRDSFVIDDYYHP